MSSSTSKEADVNIYKYEITNNNFILKRECKMQFGYPLGSALLVVLIWVDIFFVYINIVVFYTVFYADLTHQGVVINVILQFLCIKIHILCT